MASRAADDAAQRCAGECIQWSTKLGWGFIRPDDLGKNLFVHHDDLLDSEISVGDCVEFCRQPARDGESSDRAASVHIVQRQRPGGERASGRVAVASVSLPPVKRKASSLVPRAVAARVARQASSAQPCVELEKGEASSRQRPPARKRPASIGEASVLGHI
jgi:cold shock CspA family protein